MGPHCVANLYSCNKVSKSQKRPVDGICGPVAIAIQSRPEKCKIEIIEENLQSWYSTFFVFVSALEGRDVLCTKW